ncbi:MAG TPA: GtrA family protein [Vineibacter sp.]|nr:GtrA family protein [Vineibacter sp.]
MGSAFIGTISRPSQTHGTAYAHSRDCRNSGRAVKPPPTHRRLGRFIVVGIASSAIFLALAYALPAVGVPAFVGSLVAYLVSLAVAYVGQRVWTFGARHAHGYALPRYAILQTGCALATALLAEILVVAFGVSLLVMSIVTTLFAGMVSYVGTWIWVFPDSGGISSER